MSYLLLEYPKCTTCIRAKKWLNEHEIEIEARHIALDNPTAEELKKWIKQSGMPIKRLFNTSGLVYKSMKLKDKLPTMSEEEQIQLLATNGMLVKRPIVIGEQVVLVGFKIDEWERILLNR